MTDYNKMLEHCKKLSEQVRKNIAEREEAKKTLNKAFKVFKNVCEKEFVIAFDSLSEVENWIEKKSIQLWKDSKADFDLLGKHIPCNVKSLEEARNRVNKFYRVEKDSKKIKVA